jgi:hypothetical protein
MLITVLDGISRKLDNLETRFRRCSWKLSNLKDEAMEVEGVSLKRHA